jgi:acyl-CoA synthetase (NDP forming)
MFQSGQEIATIVTRGCGRTACLSKLLPNRVITQEEPDLGPHSKNLQRLFSPGSIAFVGGAIAEMAIKRSQELAYEGEIWPVHPTRTDVAGFKCYASVDDLPHAPDAVFIAVNRELTVEIVSKLADGGSGGCVCYAAGFAEMGEEGRRLQQQLVDAAGDMPLVGPNCFGLINYVDKCALWPYLFGGKSVERGAALISQSGNIAMNLTMNQRSVRFTHVIGAGNQAVLGAGDYIDALLQDDRVAAIGMYIEGVDDIDHFSRSALLALKKGVPIVVMKVGKTTASARQSISHTSSLTGADELFDALFDRLGIIRVDSLNKLLETLKVLTLGEPLSGSNIFSLSCSGGEAAIIADVAAELDLEMEPFSDGQLADLQSQFPNYVTVSNPFDYNTSIWGDQSAQERCFTTAMQGDHDAAVLVYDHPTVVSEGVDEWVMTLDALIAAHKATGMPAFTLCTISELMPKEMRDKLIANGVVPLMGLDDGLFALSAATKYQQIRANKAASATLPRFADAAIDDNKPVTLFDEWQSKSQLRECGLPVPQGGVGSATEAPRIAEQIGYPVVVKAVGQNFIHKSDIGAVALNLHNADEVAAAVARISDSVADSHGSAENFLVERMIRGAIAELIIGVNRDDQFGPALVIGAGGTLVELVAESVSLLLPTDRTTVIKSINALTAAKLIQGFRGGTAGDMDAVVSAVLVVAAFVENNWNRLMELDINPLLVLPEGQGVVAADALISFSYQE